MVSKWSEINNLHFYSDYDLQEHNFVNKVINKNLTKRPDKFLFPDYIICKYLNL